MKKNTSHPVVALIGRTNVGKSSLFNRLTESLRAITSSWAGTTRDINRSFVSWRGQEFELWDTGGMDVVDDEQLQERVIEQSLRAMEEADLLLFVIDGQVGLLPQDIALGKELRKKNIPCIIVLNKIDSETHEASIPQDVYTLEFGKHITISAKNGRDSDVLLDAITEHITAIDIENAPTHETAVALIGRPNVGKSSLLNSILGYPAVVVADKAHTTRDTNDIPYRYNDHDFLLIDTAGLRKRVNVGKRWGDARLGSIEKQSARSSIEAMERADVALIIIEAQRRVTAQDKKIIQVTADRGKGMILVINKWDLIEDKTSTTINAFEKYFHGALPYLQWVPMIFVSATEHVRVRETLDMVLRVGENFHRRIEEESLEEILRVLRGQYKPKQSATRKYRRAIAKLQSLKQIGRRPPHFYLQTDRPKEIPTALPKILERELRHRFDFEGVKIIIEIGK